MFCTQCGTENSDKSRFCRQCGHRLQAQHLQSAVEGTAVAETGEQLAAEAADLDDVGRLLDSAFELYDSGNVDQALEICLAALRVYPDSVTGRSLLSAIYEKKGDLHAAIRQMERVVDMNPESTADVNRLEGLRLRARMMASASSEPSPAWMDTARELLRKPGVLGGAVVGLTLLALAVGFSMRPRPDQGAALDVPAVAPGGAPAAAQGPLFGSTPQPAPVTSGLFEGVGSQPNQAPGTEPRRQEAPAQRTQPAESTPAAPRPAPESRPADTSRPAGTAPSAAAPTPPAAPTRAPTPADSTPPTPEPRISITRTTPSGTSSGTAAPASPTTGRALQQQAIEYKRNGQKEQAIASFRKAIDAFRRDAASEGGGFEAQQGIRSCELELKLLGAR